MDIDRPHRSNSSNCSSTTNNTTTSELFICFTSRLSSSSSMKISSKSILSPGRSRDHHQSSQISLSTSLSRRLRTNGSMRGGQASPMFPTNNNGKKRGSFENPEPSSPKVTCIGQVRVKTKKKQQGKKMIRSRSQRRSGEVSFRRVEHAKNCNPDEDDDVDFARSHLENQFLSRSLSHHHQQEGMLPHNHHRNQKWVHLPVTICEALRGFGSEFNCFLPCRSSCTTTEKDKEEKAEAAGESNGSSNSSSCGAVFARWLVAVQEGDGDHNEDGKRREIELMVGEEEEVEEEEEDVEERRRSYRRHVFEEIDFKEEKYEDVQEEEEARVSICVPPKNALLLMRCRSDPVKMAALANKFWEPPVPVLNNEDEEEKVKEVEQEEEKTSNNVAEEEKQIEEIDDQIEEVEEEKSRNVAEEKQIEEEDNQIEEEEEAPVIEIEGHQIEEEEEAPLITEKTEIEEETPLDGPSSHTEKPDPIIEDNVMEESNFTDSSVDSQLQLGSIEPNLEEEEELGIGAEEDEEEEEEAEMLTRERSEPEENLKTREDDGQTGIIKSKERDNQPLLPDCLLLMMCEPKLSMEVSKETWVCSTDFIRWLPEPSRPVKKKAAAAASAGGDEPKRRTSIDIHPPSAHHSKLQQPPRSSCSYPAKPPPRAAGAESMSAAIQQKLVGKACEPLMLKRCKSEPMRTATKLAPENCFWKNRKLEPAHRPATLGVGAAAGVGC